MEENTTAAMTSLQNTIPAVLSPPAEPENAASSTPTHTAPSSSNTSWAQWNSADAANLAPANLAVTKVQHAWERRPQSPFTRRRFKVGKVWKRAPGPAAAPASSSMFTFGATIRPESPLRAVKKMRGVRGEQVARDWDMRGSPRSRRIVTRSNGEEEGLVELGEDDEEVFGDTEKVAPQEEALRVEIEHEDGTIVELDAEEGEAEVENENWDDESMTEELVWDATLMHLAETIGEPDFARKGEGQVHIEDSRTPDQDQEIEVKESAVDGVTSQHDTNSTEQLDMEILAAQSTSPAKQPTEAAPVQRLKSALRRTSQFGPIPDGFVSPVKERQRRTINQVRLSNANRRKTLPVNFAAQHSEVIQATVEAENGEETIVTASVDRPEVIVAENEQGCAPPMVSQTGELVLIPSGVSEAVIEAALEDEESDIELGLLPVNSGTARIEVGGVDETYENAWENVDEGVPDEEQEKEHVQEQPEVGISSEALPSPEEQHVAQGADVVEADAGSASPSKLDLEPVENIGDLRPLLSLHRSPRRQSTSPVRKGMILPSSSRSHLVAFTPIKLPVYTSSSFELQNSPLSLGTPRDSMAMDIDNNNPTPLPQLARSSSAPPEEPQMSPRRPKQPRISDDTALLQAFLNRAAENKISKDTSMTAKRESMENRRDSTSVRQALASPAPPGKVVAGDILADLDPNSPSPRKQLAASLAEAAQTNGKSVDQDEDELASNAPPTKPSSSRKSGRVRKKLQTLPATTYSASTPAGPNRISIRGADSVVVLKKTEAQEIAQVTRNNTKKNKSGAVLPPMRLTRLAAEKLARADEIAPPDEQDEMDAHVSAVKAGRRGVKWAKTLESFHEGANEPDTSMLSDELNVPATEESTAPSVSDTPSKSAKLRRLRTPRLTAYRTAREEDAAAMPPPPPPLPADVLPKPRATKRSSRIATPAKLPGAAKSLLPDGLDVEEPSAAPPPPPPPPAAASTVTKLAPITRRKVAATSKLPAPASASSSISTTNTAGKENSLIKSPPKKRTAATAANGSAKAIPKLDFSSVGKMEFGNGSVGIGASPAKKGRAQALFKEDGEVSVGRKGEVGMPLGMGSPAKKRGRK